MRPERGLKARAGHGIFCVLCRQFSRNKSCAAKLPVIVFRPPPAGFCPLASFYAPLISPLFANQHRQSISPRFAAFAFTCQAGRELPQA